MQTVQHRLVGEGVQEEWRSANRRGIPYIPCASRKLRMLSIANSTKGPQVSGAGAAVQVVVHKESVAALLKNEDSAPFRRTADRPDRKVDREIIIRLFSK